MKVQKNNKKQKMKKLPHADTHQVLFFDAYFIQCSPTMNQHMKEFKNEQPHQAPAARKH